MPQAVAIRSTDFVELSVFDNKATSAVLGYKADPFSFVTAEVDTNFVKKWNSAQKTVLGLYPSPSTPEALGEIEALNYIVFSDSNSSISILSSSLTFFAKFHTDPNPFKIRSLSTVYSKPYIGYTSNNPNMRVGILYLDYWCSPLCNSNCFAIPDQNSTNCAECITGYQLNGDGNCWLDCPNGFYTDQTNTCKACPQCCSNCSSNIMSNNNDGFSVVPT